MVHVCLSSQESRARLLGSWHSTLRSRLLRCRLAGFAADLLAVVPDSFSLVWLGLADRADFGREFADELLVGALDYNVCLIRTSYGEPLGDFFVNFIREAHAKLQSIT